MSQEQETMQGTTDPTVQKAANQTAGKNEKVVVKDKSKRKILFFAGAGAALVLVAAVIACITVFGGSGRKLQEQLDLGAKYLEEMDYEQALVAFHAALEIDPQNADAYLGIVEVYTKTNDCESALEYAQKGYEATGDERLKGKMDVAGHTWTDATCTEAKTCSKCGETEGEPLGHTWVEATCTEAKRCRVCGETEGEPLGHTLTDANYQQPATCKACGETVGDVLTPAFEEHGVKGQFMELGKTYDYVTLCYKDTNYKTIGHVTVTDYQTFASDDTHEAKAGYEWKTVEMQVVFWDENARKYGFHAKHCNEDYYDIIGYDDSVKDNGDVQTYTVNFNGQDYPECIHFRSVSDSGWKDDHTRTLIISEECLYPVGYDGGVVGLYDASISREDGMYIYDVANDDTLFFRLN